MSAWTFFNDFRDNLSVAAARKRSRHCHRKQPM